MQTEGEKKHHRHRAHLTSCESLCVRGEDEVTVACGEIGAFGNDIKSSRFASPARQGCQTNLRN